MTDRATPLAEAVAAAGLDLYLVTDLLNVEYLTGFTGTNGACLVGEGRRRFLTDFRYAETLEPGERLARLPKLLFVDERAPAVEDSERLNGAPRIVVHHRLELLGAPRGVEGRGAQVRAGCVGEAPVVLTQEPPDGKVHFIHGNGHAQQPGGQLVLVQRRSERGQMQEEFSSPVWMNS